MGTIVTDDYVPPEPESDVDPQLLRSAKDLMLQLVKTMKTARLYLANNPMRQKFIAELFDKFDLHLRTYGTLRLKVKQSAFLVDGQSIYENDNRQESLAFRCYVDGLSELAFLEGFEQRELVEFLEVLSSERQQEAVDDDLVSLIWRRHLPHITYVVVDDLPQTEDVPDLSQPKDVMLDEMVRHEVTAAPMMSVTGPKRLEFPLTVFKLTDEEIDQLKSQIAKEQQRDAVAQLLNILIVMLEIEHDEVSFGEVLELIEKLIELFIDRGDLIHATASVQSIRRLYDQPPPDIEAFRPKLRQCLLRVGGQERLQAVATLINDQESADHEVLLAYLQALTPEAVVPITSLLGTVNSLNARKVICEALIHFGRHDIDLLASRLRDSRWFVVRNLIYVLGRVGGPKVIEHFSPLAHHPEPRVRKELVKTLDGMELSKSVDLLIELLNDQESGVRMAVLRALARRKAEQVFAPLAAMIDAREFEAKELSEKLEVFLALASSGHADALDLCKRHLRRTSWWKRAGQEQLRWCAAYAMKQMGTPEALAILEEGSQGRNRRLQEACLAALRGTARELMFKQAKS